MFRRNKKKFTVILRGENFPIRTENGIDNLGFFSTRTVIAKSVEEAEEKAIELIRNDSKLTSVMADQDQTISPPKIFVEEISLCGYWAKTGGKGYTFFDMDKINE